METKQKINSLGLLRCIAVIAVCFCHFGDPLSKNNVLSPVFNAFHFYGKYGVNIFFVISGFIIPLSMDKAKYSFRYFFNFLSKRAVRLHPPYLIALALTFVIVAISNKVKHIPFPETIVSMIESCFYLHVPANNPVFWTLQIEAEYYIFMGIYFVSLKKYPRVTLCITLPLFLILSQTSVVNYFGLFDYLIFFLIGTIGYLIYNKSGSTIFESVCLISLIIFSFIYYDLAASIAVSFTIIFILLYHGSVNKIFSFGGEISYSIYLIHFPIGVKLINLTLRHVGANSYSALFLLTNIIVFLIAAIFWKFIEKPSAELSNKIKYGISRNAPTPLLLKTI